MDEDEYGNILADMALTLMQYQTKNDETWRIVIALVDVIEELRDLSDDEGGDHEDKADELLLGIVGTLMYTRVDVIPSDEEIDYQAKMFNDFLDKTGRFSKDEENDSNKEEETKE